MGIQTAIISLQMEILSAKRVIDQLNANLSGKRHGLSYAFAISATTYNEDCATIARISSELNAMQSAHDALIHHNNFLNGE